jgi:tetratricopeptide (TPR) repeat protein
MQIRRDYSQPFFSGGKRSRRRSLGKLFFVLGLLVGGVMIAVTTQFDQIRATAMDVLGTGPTATPFPGERANAAVSAYLNGDTQTAITLFESALAERPDDLDYLYEYGLILIEMDETERAREFGEKAIEINSFDPRGYVLKGRALLWSGDSAAAIPILLQGMTIDDQFSPIYANLARAYVSIGNYRLGLENGEKAVQLDPMGAESRRSYAFALSSAGAYDEAMGQLEQGIIANPSHVQLYFELAFQYLSRDRNDQAITLYEQILTLQPRNARAMLRLCDAYRKIGQFDQGEDMCQSAVRADPTFSTAQFRLGMIKYSNRDFVSAQTAFQACMDNDSENYGCAYRLGLTHYYLSLDAKADELDILQVPTIIPPTPEETDMPNEMLEMAMQAIAAQGSPTPGMTQTVTLTPSAEAPSVSSEQHCERAWTLLQETLPKAQAADDEAAVSDIRLGLSLVAQDCPAFFGAAPMLATTPTPTMTTSPTLDPFAFTAAPTMDEGN